MSIRLAVFDMAGTTIADKHAVAGAFCEAFMHYGIDGVSESDVRPLMGYKKPIAIRLVLEQKGKHTNGGLIDDIHDHFVSTMIRHYASSPEVGAMQDAEDTFLQFKRKGIGIALNTGFSKSIADVIMQRLQWKASGLIDEYIASDEVQAGRPEPYMILELMKRSGVEDPGEVIKIGDTEVDINEGRNAGCSKVIAVTTGAFTREQLAAYQPDHIIDHLSQLPEII